MSNIPDDLVYPHAIVYASSQAAMETTTMESAELIGAFEAFRYQDGEEIQKIWNPAFVFFAYLLSCVSSYAAVHLLDHGLWRSDESKKVAVAIRYPDIHAACLLAFGSVWSMHFVSSSC